MLTYDHLLTAALSAAVPGKRIPKSWSGKVQARERIAGSPLRPMMGDVWQWLIEPRAGESERAFARRAVDYAAQRAGLVPDAALVRSVRTMLERR